MAKRYVTAVRRPRLGSDWYEADACASRTVHEMDSTLLPTGILDASGSELFAVVESDPIGFVRF